MNDRASTISPTDNEAANAASLFGLEKPPGEEQLDADTFVYPDPSDPVVPASPKPLGPMAAECEARTPAYTWGELAWVGEFFGTEDDFLRTLGLNSGKAEDREDGRIIARAMIAEELRKGTLGWENWM